MHWENCTAKPPCVENSDVPVPLRDQPERRGSENGSHARQLHGPDTEPGLVDLGDTVRAGQLELETSGMVAEVGLRWSRSRSRSAEGAGREAVPRLVAGEDRPAAGPPRAVNKLVRNLKD